MANINVDIFTDENDGVGVGNGTSLREAIIAANTNGDAENTIVLPSGTYDLTIEGGSEDAGATGDFDILDDGSGKTLTITGAGAETTIIDAGGIDRVFDVLPGATLNISDVTVTGGATPSLDPFTGGLGGGFLVQGILNGSNLVIDDNQAANGGGIFVNTGVTNLTDSTVSNNSVTFDGGGISSLFGGQLTADNITVSGNTAARNAGGIGVAFQGSATVSNSTITNNQTLGTVDTSPLPVGVGGGIHINDGSGTITNSVIDGNTAATSGGGIAVGGGDPTGQGNPAPVSAIITDTTLTNNIADGNGDGSGTGGSISLLTDTGSPQVENLSLAGNSPERRFVLLDSFSFDDAEDVSAFITPEGGLQSDGVAFNPVTQTLFLAHTDAPNGPPPNRGVLQFGSVDPDSSESFGTFIDEFDVSASPGFITAVGITALENGNLLIASALNSRIVEVDSTGAVVAGGIDFAISDEFLDRSQRGVPVGIAYTQADTVLILTSRSFEVVEFDLAGNELSSLDLGQYGLNLPAGLTIDPSTGNLFVSEDFRGTNKIYEITPAREELVVSGEPRLGDLVSIIDTNAEFGIDDPEGLSIAPDGTFYVVFDGDDEGAVGNQVAAFALNSDPADIPTLGTVDKYNFAGTETSFALEDFTEKLVDIEPFAGPAFVDPQGDDLASITIASLPGNGALSLSGADVAIGDEIAADDIDELVYTSNASFGGVDTFFVTASDGVTDSQPGHIDVFVSAPQSIQLTLENTYDFESADGLTFNPTTGTLFATEALRQDPTDPDTVTWVLRELNPETGAVIRTVVESEDNLEGDDVPDLDISPDLLSEGIQGMAVVQGTGTERDGNLILLSTRGQAVVEVDPDTGTQVTAEDGGFEFISDVIFSFVPPSSITGIYHALDDAGNEVLYAADFRGRQIIQFAKDGSVNDDAAIDLFQAIPEAELQGIVIDPVTGNFLLADDATGNSSSIYEVTPDGELVGTTSLLELGGDARFADTEGLGINPETRELYIAIDDDLRNPNFNIDEIGDQIAVFSLNAAPSLGAVDKFGLAGTDITFALGDFTEKLVDIEPFAGPAFVDPEGDELASITIASLPEDGTLSFSGADVAIGDEIAADDIDELVYTSDATFGGVDTFSVTASDGIADSQAGEVNLFVSSLEGTQFTLETTYDFESADGLTFNPTTGTLFATEALRQDPTDPDTVTWVLRELGPETGAVIRTVVESEDNLEGDDVPDLDISPDLLSEGIQGMAVVQGTGTERDGNLILLSTRGQAVVEVDPDTGAQVTAEEGGFEFISPVIFSATTSVTGIYHALDDAGNEVLYTTDFRGLAILEFAKDGTQNEDATIDLTSEIPEAELQGIVIDPATGNFLLADDATGNSSSIYEVTPDGELISTTNLLQLGGDDRFADTEGLGINPITRELYVAIDDDLRNPNFNIDEIGDQIAVFQLTARVGGNRISTGSGDDLIYVSNNDKAFGGSEDDTFFTTGGTGNRMSGGSGDDTFYLGNGDRVLGGSEDDTFFGANGSNNRISGGSGDDVFFLGSGDRAFGGSGADVFWITSSEELPTEANTVGGFELGVDVIGVTDYTFGDLEFDRNTISIGGVEVANVVGVNTATLSESDFLFA